MSDQAGILPKWFSNRGIILAKGQLDHSYTFWIMPILILSPVQIIRRHPLSPLMPIRVKVIFKRVSIRLLLDDGKDLFQIFTTFGTACVQLQIAISFYKKPSNSSIIRKEFSYLHLRKCQTADAFVLFQNMI